MPAIDPHRLASEVERLKAQSGEPTLIARETKALLAYYSDDGRVKVPAPVLRALARALEQSSAEHPLDSPRALWKGGSPEAKVLAAGLLGNVENESVAAVVERWANQDVPTEVVQELGERGTTGWRRAHREHFLKQVVTWLSGKSRRSRVLALYALGGIVTDPRFDDLPVIYSVLEDHLSARGEAREALIALLKMLRQEAPDETALYLREHGATRLG